MTPSDQPVGIPRGLGRLTLVTEAPQLDWFVPDLRWRAHRAIGPALRRVTSTSELVQETLGVAVERFDRLVGKPALVVRAWLAKALNYHVLNHLHHAGNAPTDLGSRDPSDHGPSISDEFVRMLVHHEVRRAVAALPEVERQVIVGLYHDRVTTDELAQRLGRTVAAVYGLHHRALDRLRKHLSDLEP